MTVQQPAIEMIGVTRIEDGRAILADLDWTVAPDQRWIVLGRNGSGKSTLLRIASLYLHPSSGTVRVLGEELGRTDVRQLRRRVGYSAAAFADLLRPALSVRDVVMTAKFAALEPWWHTYEDADRERAVEMLGRVGCESLAGHLFATLSSGERQRVLLARTLFTEPGVILLDEPTAALDLAGREQLVANLDALAADATTPPIVLVTHHVEEIPPSFTHALLLRDGRTLAKGPIEECMNAETLSQCFELSLELERRDGRWLAWARR
ncbi:MAG: ATP-binding cassette domain-containing protein [Acidimicrobiales bacterium]